MEPQSGAHTIVELKHDAAGGLARDSDVELGEEVTISTWKDNAADEDDRGRIWVGNVG